MSIKKILFMSLILISLSAFSSEIESDDKLKISATNFVTLPLYKNKDQTRQIVDVFSLDNLYVYSELTDFFVNFSFKKELNGSKNFLINDPVVGFSRRLYQLNKNNSFSIKSNILIPFSEESVKNSNLYTSIKVSPFHHFANEVVDLKTGISFQKNFHQFDIKASGISNISSMEGVYFNFGITIFENKLFLSLDNEYIVQRTYTNNTADLLGLSQGLVYSYSTDLFFGISHSYGAPTLDKSYSQRDFRLYSKDQSYLSILLKYQF